MLMSIWRRVDQWFFQGKGGRARTIRRNRPKGLRFEVLEDRVTPANFSATIVGNNLTIAKIGSGSSTLTITDSGDFQKFTITPGAGDTINGGAGGGAVTTLLPVTGIIVNLGSGTDSLTFDGAANGAINLSNGLRITGTGGNKTISSNLMNILNKGGLTINLSGSGSETATFTDTNISGATKITHSGSGDTSFTVKTSSNNPSLLNQWGSLTINNSAGADFNSVKDTDFAAAVVINNGAGSGNNSQFGGSHNIFSAERYQTLLTVTGGLTITTSSGQSDTQVFDYNVYGALTIGAGSGVGTIASYIGIENNQTVSGNGIPIFGSVVITGGSTGNLNPGLNIDLGTDSGGSDFFMRVNGALTITANGTGSATIDLNDLIVGGASSITLGGNTSNNTLNVHGDDAFTYFAGMTVTSNARGNNTFNIQTIKGNADFTGGLSFKLSSGNDVVNVGSSTGFVSTRNNFGVTGTGGSKIITAVNGQFGGLAFAVTGSGAQTALFTDTNVSGAATLSHTGTGGTSLTINTSNNNTNALNYWNSLTVTNGSGADINNITDTMFSAGVAINNGAGAGGNTSQFGGSHTTFAASRYAGMLVVSGGLTVTTASGQSDTEINDYDVHGSVTLTTGSGISGQGAANFVGFENNQTIVAIPVIGGSLTITGNSIGAAGLTVDVGTDGGSNDYPVVIQTNLTVKAQGTGAANIDLNDLNVANGTTTITLGGNTHNNVVSIQGSSVTAVLWNLVITSSATGNNTFNLQNQAGNLQLTGTVNATLGNGNDVVNLAANSVNSNGVTNAVVEMYGVSKFNGGAGVDFIYGGTLGTNLFYNIVPVITNF